MMQAKHELLAALGAAVARLAPGQPYAPAFERPRQAAHGDLAITAAMQLARPLRRNPRELAAALIEALRADPAAQRWVRSFELAGPGFINLHLAPAAHQAVVREILAAGAAFGRRPPSGRRLMVEFVSANPTGPLHLGHGRQAALGDAICHLYETQGWEVAREFYYNDAGVQIATLARSTQARIEGRQPGDPGWPEDAYNGDYVADIAAAFMARETVHADDREFTANADATDLDAIRGFAVAFMRREQDLDLRSFGVKFDRYFLESSLYADGKVAAAVERIRAAGQTYEQDGALWLRATAYGDDKDRVMRKSDGTYTYFVPDVAYHIDKWTRGFDKVINIQGGDHHGTVARVRAGLQAARVGVPAGWPDYLLHKMVRVMRRGEEVKISKRAGGYVTLRDLIDWTSRDAVRFFLVSRKADTEYTFDVDLALAQSDENPVYYVQYAHARICSVLAQYAQRRAVAPAAIEDGSAFADADLARLAAPSEFALMGRLAAYPDMLAGAAAELAPHDVAFYLRELAAALHGWYASERFLVDDPALAQARAALLAATRQVLRNALAVIGVGAPTQMVRATETAGSAA